MPGINATGPQLFFINFAQIWCGSMRREALHNKLKTAVHPPGKFRYLIQLLKSFTIQNEIYNMVKCNFKYVNNYIYINLLPEFHSNEMMFINWIHIS